MGGIFDIINVPIGYILRGCYALVDNYGIAILLFALITRLLLLPLGIKSEKGRRKMMKAQPRIQQLQQKYKGNTRKEKGSNSTITLYTPPTSLTYPDLSSRKKEVRQHLLTLQFYRKE